MSRVPRWEMMETTDGVVTIRLSHWKWFADFVSQKLLDYRTYVYRGQASENWKLESTLDRALKRIGKDRREDALASHLANFKLAVRGRRGPSPPQMGAENDWWALGQHHGLVTPLLDWTESPFVALYFAFNEIENDGADHRSVWAVFTQTLEDVRERSEDETPPDWNFDPSELDVVRPLSDENSRLVNQRGLFVRCPYQSTLERVVGQVQAGNSEEQHLIKFLIPNKERTVCLRMLNRMNISHLSLFPDLHGASVYCNTDLRIEDY